jgi:hypothetical protein
LIGLLVKISEESVWFKVKIIFALHSYSIRLNWDRIRI